MRSTEPSSEEYADGDHRTGLREADRHGSWREVYNALGVDPDSHENTVDLEGEEGSEW